MKGLLNAALVNVNSAEREVRFGEVHELLKSVRDLISSNASSGL